MSDTLFISDISVYYFVYSLIFCLFISVIGVSILVSAIPFISDNCFAYLPVFVSDVLLFPFIFIYIGFYYSA